jgi:hypothetical protein
MGVVNPVSIPEASAPIVGADTKGILKKFVTLLLRLAKSCANPWPPLVLHTGNPLHGFDHDGPITNTGIHSVCISPACSIPLSPKLALPCPVPGALPTDPSEQSTPWTVT